MGKSERTLKKLVSLLVKKTKTSGYDTQAVVRRIEGNTAWVHIPGGVDETPVKLTIDAKKGDSVQVRVGGGKAFLVGNSTAPPTDDTTAIKADSKAVKADRLAQVAQKAADDARKTATNYLSWTAEDGLIISEDATENPSEMTGGSTRITSSGVGVYQGQDEVGHFGVDENGYKVLTIEDGTNSATVRPHRIELVSNASIPLEIASETEVLFTVSDDQGVAKSATGTGNLPANQDTYTPRVNLTIGIGIYALIGVGTFTNPGGSNVSNSIGMQITDSSGNVLNGAEQRLWTSQAYWQRMQVFTVYGNRTGGMRVDLRLASSVARSDCTATLYAIKIG
jgi:hypothetical protein